MKDEVVIGAAQVGVKMVRFVCALVQLGVLASLTACANFGRLEQDLENYSADNIELQGVVRGTTKQPQPIVIVYFKDLEQGGITKLRILSGDGNFRLLVDRNGGWLFAFVDANQDLKFQPGEEYGWYNGGEPLGATGSDQSMKVNIRIGDGAGPPPPAAIVNRSLADVVNFRQISVGQVAALDEERFSPESAEQGMWQPYKSLMDGYAGLFMLDEYDPAKVPVVFVHGVSGTPRSFEQIFTSLDQSRYQAWFLNYPSGFSLPVLGAFFYQAMELLEYRYSFANAHVVAHSMGGLVARQYLNNCSEQGRCDYLRSYTSIASPYGGMPSASMGVEYAPTSIPVWSDLAPESDFLANLFVADLPQDLRFNLVFTFHTDDLIGGQSSDGVVALVSQLRPAAQAQADRLWGIDATHVGVLTDEEFLQGFSGLLAE